MWVRYFVLSFVQIFGFSVKIRFGYWRLGCFQLQFGEIYCKVIMGLKRTRFESRESSNQGGFDARTFVNAAAHARYQWLR